MLCVFVALGPTTEGGLGGITIVSTYFSGTNN